MNYVHLIGHLGADPEMRYTPEGSAVATFRLAVNDGFGDKKTVSFFPIVAWNKQAESCNQYLRKGMKVAVTGKLRERSWDGDDGKKHYKTEVVARDIEFLTPKEKGTGADDDFDFDFE